MQGADYEASMTVNGTAKGIVGRARIIFCWSGIPAHPGGHLHGNKDSSAERSSSKATGRLGEMIPLLKAGLATENIRQLLGYVLHYSRDARLKMGNMQS